MSKKYIALDDVLTLLDTKMCGDPIKHKVIEAVLNLPTRSRYEAITSKSIYDLAIFFNDTANCCYCAFDHGSLECRQNDCIEGIESWLKGEAEDGL